MFVLTGNFTIADDKSYFTFNAINNVEINHSIEDISDTAVIKMPTKFTVKQNGELKYTEEVIKVGNKVSITLGYKNCFKKVEFNGYVSSIKFGTPMEIHCEDAIWQLKRRGFKFSKQKTSLKEVLAAVVQGTELKLAKNIPDMPFEKFTLKSGNCAQVLKYIKDTYPTVSIYLNDSGELYAGLKELNNIHQVVEYDLNYNLVENKLEFKSAEDRRVKIIYTCTTKDNKKIQVEVGDEDGEKIEVNTQVIYSKEKLTEMAEQHLANAKYDGFEGDITSFLVPYATRGMAAQITDTKHPNRNGKYFIKKVTTTYGTSGARRKISLSNKLQPSMKEAE